MPILCAFVGAIIGLVGDEMGVDGQLSHGAAARITVGSVFGYVGAQGGKFLRLQLKKRA